MLRGLITTLLIFAFVTPGLARIGQCEMTSPHCTNEMACCQQAQSVTGSAAARLCCEIFCGEPLDKGAGLTANVTLPALAVVPIVSFTSSPVFTPLNTAQAELAIRVVNSSLCQHRPPPLFLSHSAFLI
ncbi:MAG: hypothetical protein JNM09_18405 [Blastocatellia bacterium]|nr:hypothetical protein [Blastocatellia bacterium]